MGLLGFSVGDVIGPLLWMRLITERAKDEMSEMRFLLRYTGGRRNIPVYAGPITGDSDIWKSLIAQA